MEKVASENVVKGRSCRGVGHCEKKDCSERRLQECNTNCNHFQHVGRGDDDDVESDYFTFENKQEWKEVLNEILKNDKISSETKRSCENTLYEVTKKAELEESDDTLSSKGSNGKDSLPENKKERLMPKQNKINKAFNSNVNSFSTKNQKNLQTSFCQPQKVFPSQLAFNNNAEGGRDFVTPKKKERKRSSSRGKRRKSSAKYEQSSVDLSNQKIIKLFEELKNLKSDEIEVLKKKSPSPMKKIINLFQDLIDMPSSRIESLKSASPTNKRRLISLYQSFEQAREKKRSSSEHIHRTAIINPTKHYPRRKSNMTKEENEQYLRDYNRITKGAPYYMYPYSESFKRWALEDEDDDDVFE